ncbi:MAG: hypothetical protein LBJ07_00970 [Actinomycetes bacterium]|jgi:hypothetical protein|nr:hypothetical protein [Actinomycetes bacterium]
MSEVTPTRKALFSVGLYREGLAQLKLPALLLGIVTVVLNALIPIVGWLSDSGNPFDGQSIEMIGLVGFAILYVYVAPIVLSLRLFNFGNARNRSDFYHGLPPTRVSLWLSFLAAIASWLVGTVVVAIGVSTGLYALMGAHIVLASIPIMIAFLGCGALYLCVATALAMTVTGTLLSNIVVTILIVCFPRYVSSLFASTVAAGVPNLPSSQVGLFNLRLSNTLFMLPSVFSESNIAGGAIARADNMLYTLALTVVLGAVGLWLFVHRRSEDADKSAPSRSMQLVYRVCVALVPALGIVATVSLNTGTLYVLSYAELWPIIILLGTLSAIAFCVFELLTTKSWKSLARALPSFGLVIAITWAFWAVAALDVRYETGFRPGADDIAWVRVIDTSYYHTDGSGEIFWDSEGEEESENNVDYAELVLSRTRISDSAVLSAIARQLAGKDTDRWSSVYDSDANYSLVEIKTKGGRSERRLLVESDSEGQSSPFALALIDSPELFDAILSLPTEKEVVSIQGIFLVPGQMVSGSAKATQLTQETWANIVAEYQTLDTQERYGLLFATRPLPEKSNETTSLAQLNNFNLTISSTQGLSNLKIDLQVNDEYLPQTTEFLSRKARDQIVAGLASPQSLVQENNVLAVYETQQLTNNNASKDPGGDALGSDAGESGEALISLRVPFQGEADDRYDFYVVSRKAYLQGLDIFGAALARDFDTEARYVAELTLNNPDRDAEEMEMCSLVWSISDAEAQRLLALGK